MPLYLSLPGNPPRDLKTSAAGFCLSVGCVWICAAAVAKPFRDGNGIAALARSLASRGGESEQGGKPGWDGKAVAADLSIRSEICYVEARHWLAAAPGPVGAAGRAGSVAGVDGVLTCAR